MRGDPAAKTSSKRRKRKSHKWTIKKGSQKSKRQRIEYEEIEKYESGEESDQDDHTAISSLTPLSTVEQISDINEGKEITENVSKENGSSSCNVTLPNGVTVTVDTLKLMEEMKKFVKKEVEEVIKAQTKKNEKNFNRALIPNTPIPNQAFPFSAFNPYCHPFYSGMYPPNCNSQPILQTPTPQPLPQSSCQPDFFYSRKNSNGTVVHEFHFH